MSLTIKQRLFVNLLIPFAALVALILVTLSDQWAKWQEGDRVLRTIDLIVATAEAIHYLQIERGTSNGFLQSNGKRFSDVLPARRKRSN